jgi:hypothetical protein
MQFEIMRKYMKGLQNEETTYEVTIAKMLILCPKLRRFSQ